MNVILRLQHLKTKLPAEQVLGEITSYNFLLRIRNLLCNTDYIELLNDFVEHNLDNLVAAGLNYPQLPEEDHYGLGPLVDKLRGKPKSKGVHVVASQPDERLSKERELELVYAVDNHPPPEKWWGNEFKFPCPIPSH